MASGIALASLGYSLYVLITEDRRAYLIVLLSVYFAITFFRQLFYIVLLLLIALSPLICIILCFVCCCCMPGEGAGGQYIDIPTKNPTQTDMINCEGTCSICRMNIDEGSKVYVLPCSEKHIFHSMCLSQWAKIKNTCPNCRALIPMTRQGR